jgi:hypothetical protein
MYLHIKAFSSTCNEQISTFDKVLNKWRTYGFIVFILCCSLESEGQDKDIYQKYNIHRNPFKVFLNKFSLTLTTGYGATNYSHDLEGVYFYQDASSQFIFSNNIEDPTGFVSGYANWLNDPTETFISSVENPFGVPFDYLGNPVNNPALLDQQFLVNTDTVDLGFRGVSSSIPISFTIHYNYEDFRFGGGFTYEQQFMSSLRPTAFEVQLRDYEPNFKSTSFTRWYGLVGYRFYQFWYWDFVAEMRLGKINPGKAFNRNAISRGLNTNIGVSFENNWSEYFRLIIRPSLDFKGYTVDLPDGASVRHSHPTFFIQAGISINIPEIPRSPMKSDHVQLKHVYTDPKTGKKYEVRGQPITKRQNPKVGENHRRLWRYKKKNKKKLNPY